MTNSDVQTFDSGNGAGITCFKSEIPYEDEEFITNFGLLLKKMIHLQELHLILRGNSFESILLIVGSLKSIINLKLSGFGGTKTKISGIESSVPVNTSIKSLTLFINCCVTDLQFIFNIFKNVENFYIRSDMMCRCEDCEKKFTECSLCFSKWIQLISSLSHLNHISINYRHLNEAFSQSLQSLKKLQLIEILEDEYFYINDVMKKNIVSLLKSCIEMIQKKKEPDKFYILMEAKMFNEYINNYESAFFNPYLIVRQTFKHSNRRLRDFWNH